MPTLTESYWPATDDADLVDMSCGDILREAAQNYANRIALVDANSPASSRRRWTYSDLYKDSENLARHLAERFPQGSHIAIWGENSPEWVICQFALALAGMVLVTVNPALKTEELSFVLKHSKSRGIFYQQQYRGTEQKASVENACEAAQIELELVCSLDEIYSLRGNQSGSLPVVSPRDPVMIQYTSGTTGQPKGALLSHHSVVNNARLMAILKELDENTVNLAVAPLFHTAGCVANVLGSAQTGGSLVLPASFNAASMLDLIAEEKVSYTFGVPTMLIALLEEQANKPRDLTSLQTVFSGAATVPVDVVKRVEQTFSARLIIGYGQTETSPAITHTRLNDSPVDKSETIGYPIPQTEVKIIDPETGRTLPVGQAGELCTRGFLLMMGYFDNPEATAKTIDNEGWLHTGDLCSMDARGYCRITGRLKDLIIRGGENIYPREIEEVLYSHPAVSEVAVIGIPDDYWGEEVGAVVKLVAGETADGGVLQEYLGDKLAKHKIPKHWFALQTIPATASGKLQKFKLVEMARDGSLEASRV